MKTNNKINNYLATLTDMKEYFETLVEKKQDQYDSHESESWYEGDKAYEMQEDIETLESLSSAVDDLITELETSIEF